MTESISKVRRARTADYVFWMQKDAWDPTKAAILLAGFPPEEFPDGDIEYSTLAGDADAILQLIVKCISDKKLSVKNSPADWISWFKQAAPSVPLPAALITVLPAMEPTVVAIDTGTATPLGDQPKDGKVDSTMTKPRTKMPRFHMTRAALIAAHEHEWPTVGADLTAASENGLSKAKAGPRGWYEDICMEWARANNKLIRTEAPANPLAAAINRMSSLPGRQHTLDG